MVAQPTQAPAHSARAKQEVLRQAARRGFGVFARFAAQVLLGDSTEYEEGPFQQSLYHVVRVMEVGGLTRVLVTAPPRHGKSLILSVIGTAWRIGRSPHLKVMDVSYGESLSQDRSRQFRRLVTSDLFQWIFPEVEISRDTVDLVETTHGGGRRAVTLQGAMTGHGADLIVVDDPMKAQAAESEAQLESALEAFLSALLTRLNNQQTGQILFVAQRLNERDLAATLLETGVYKHFNYPALAPCDLEMPLSGGRTYRRPAGEALCPARMPADTLEQLRREMGPARFEAQYQQDPDAMDGGRVDWSKVGRCDIAPERSELDWVVFSLDPAVSEESTACYSALTVWGGRSRTTFLLHVYRGRWTTPDLLDKLAVWGRQWRPHYLLVEDNGVGRPLADLLLEMTRRRENWIGEAGTLVRRISVRDSKTVRFDLCLDILHSGRVLIPNQAAWLPPYQRELSAHPLGGHNDQIDSTSQFLNWARRNERALDYRPGQRPPGRTRPPGLRRR